MVLGAFGVVVGAFGIILDTFVLGGDIGRNIILKNEVWGAPGN